MVAGRFLSFVNVFQHRHKWGSKDGKVMTLQLKYINILLFNKHKSGRSI